MSPETLSAALSATYIAIKFNPVYKIERIQGDRVVMYSLQADEMARATNAVVASAPLVTVRFSAMSDVANIVKSSYKSTHLTSSFPAFPSRCYNPSIDQFASSFLTERTANLECFWRNLVGMPKIEESSDLRRFLGLPVNEGMTV